MFRNNITNVCNKLNFRRKSLWSCILCKVIYSVGIVLGSVFFSGQLVANPPIGAEINLSAISTIESSNNSKAYNRISQATGLFQITPVCLEDYNSFARREKFSLDDMFNQAKAEKVAKWYLYVRIPQLLKHYGHDVTTRNVLVAYNCGVSCLTRSSLPTETQQYISKYERMVTHD